LSSRHVQSTDSRLSAHAADFAGSRLPRVN